MQKLKSLAPLFILGFIGYLLFNLIHFTWKFISPEGFWSFSLFVGTLRIVFISIILLVLGVIFFSSFIAGVFKSFKTGFDLKAFFNPLLYLVFMIISVGIDVAFGLGPSIFITKKMSDKYSYVSQSNTLINQGEYQKAIEESQKAYEELTSQKSVIHPFFFLSHFAQKKGFILSHSLEEKYGIIVNYAYCIQSLRNEFDKAKSLYQEAIHIVEQENPSNQAEYMIFPTLQLAEIEMQRGNYGEMERLFQEIKRLGNDIEGDTFYLNYYLIHGKYALQIGDHRKANQLFVEAYEYLIKSEYPEKTSIFRTLAVKAAEAQLALGEIDKSGRILEDITSQMNKRKDRAEYLIFLHVRAMYCFVAAQSSNDGNKNVLDRNMAGEFIDWINPNWSLNRALFEKGFEDLQELGELLEDKEGRESLGFASNLISIAGYLESFEKYSEAVEYYTQAKNIIESSQEVDLEILNKLNLGLARVQFHLGNNSEFLKLADDIRYYSLSKIQNNFPFLSEEEREKFILNQNYGFNMTNAIYTLSDSETHSSKIYDNIVTVKGIALSSNIKFRNLLQASSQSLFNEYLAIQKEKESFQDVSFTDSESLKMKSQIELQEKEFIDKVRRTVGLDLILISENTAEKVTSVLKDDEVAIEIFTVPTSKNFRDSILYYGAILKKEYENPKIIELFSEDELNSALKVTGGFANQINKIYRVQKDKLVDLFWSKLASEAKGKKRVFLSVSGALNGLSIPSLLIDEPFELVLLSSTKNILNSDKEDNRYITRASVFGDPNFSSTGYQELDQLKNSSQDKVRGNIYEKLPFTREEALAISRLLGSNRLTEVDVFLDNEASEENLRLLSGRKTNLLHLATHGYFIENQIQKPNHLLIGNAQNPLLNSGLILASSMKSNQFNSMEDGVVTALDISKMDFSNTDMVVLSACETGLGIQLGGEGVFGLQRAFKIAGAKSIMVSLWKVPDSQTALLMEAFYSFLSSGKSPEESLKFAQLKIREKFPEPFYWAGFVLISD